MKRITSLSVLAILVSMWVFAAEGPKAEKPGPPPAESSSIEQRLKEKPDDLAAWNRYTMSKYQELMPLVNSNPDEAQKRIDSMREFVNSLQPTQDETKNRLAGIKSAIGLWEQWIQLGRTTRAELEVKLNANPDDATTISLYAQKVRMELLPLAHTATGRAEEGLKTAKAFLDGVKAKARREPAKKALADADQTLARLHYSIDAAKRAAELARLPRRELEAELKANPDNGSMISMYGQKLYMELGPLSSSNTQRAEDGLNSARDFLDGLRAKVKDEAAKKSLEGADRLLSQLQKSIDRAKRLAGLIGKDAAPLEVEAWVNGDPLTEADLKGKVVLLDFWAVWFGPCIATFPHLREWHEQYADRGLVIVGLTRYYNYAWDPEANRPMRAQGKKRVAPEKEREMLAKFAERHKLHHRFAIQKDDALSDYYGVSGMPHVVLIDRGGKIRLIRVVGGEKRTQEIQEMLEKLIATET